MQALNSLLHTMSYGTPLSELNKLHYEIRDKYDGYNQQVENQLQTVIGEAKNIVEEDDDYNNLDFHDDEELERLQREVEASRYSNNNQEQQKALSIRSRRTRKKRPDNSYR